MQKRACGAQSYTAFGGTCRQRSRSEVPCLLSLAAARRPGLAARIFKLQLSTSEELAELQTGLERLRRVRLSCRKCTLLMLS